MPIYIGAKNEENSLKFDTSKVDLNPVTIKLKNNYTQNTVCKYVCARYLVLFPYIFFLVFHFFIVAAASSGNIITIICGSSKLTSTPK